MKHAKPRPDIFTRRALSVAAGVRRQPTHAQALSYVERVRPEVSRRLLCEWACVLGLAARLEATWDEGRDAYLGQFVALIRQEVSP